MRVHVFSPDLFFLGKLRQTLASGGHSVSSGPSLGDGSEVAIVDIGPTAGPDWGRHIQSARRAGVPVVAFGPHHDVGRLGRAKGLGADLVVANALMMRDPLSVLDSLALKRDAEGAAGGPDGQGHEGPKGGR